MQKKLNIKGFGAIEGLLILIIIGLVSFVGWYVYKANKDNPKVTPSTAKEVIASAPWKEHCSSSNKVCFSYPADWILEQQVLDSNLAAADTSVSEATYDVATITSPGGTVIHWSNYVQGLGGACNQNTDPDFFITKAEPTKVADVYLIETTYSKKFDRVALYSKINSFFSDPKIGDTGSCALYSLFKTKSTPHLLLFQAAANDIHGSDLHTVEKILLTFHEQV